MKAPKLDDLDLLVIAAFCAAITLVATVLIFC
jgi:hypothetical protein